VHIRGISKGNFRVLLLQPIRGQSVCCSEWCFLREGVSEAGEKWTKVYLEEVQDEPIGQNSTSDANIAEQVEIAVAREAPPQLRGSARLRAAREILLLDSDETTTYAEAMMDPDSEKW
jgi:hypothetical protein